MKIRLAKKNKGIAWLPILIVFGIIAIIIAIIVIPAIQGARGIQHDPVNDQRGDPGDGAAISQPRYEGRAGEALPHHETVQLAGAAQQQGQDGVEFSTSISPTSSWVKLLGIKWENPSNFVERMKSGEIRMTNRPVPI